MADVRGDELEVRVRGTLFTGWQSVRVTRSLEAASGVFALETNLSLPIPVAQEDEVELRIGGEVVMRGYAEELELEGDEVGSRFRVTGRDRTADLVDCSDLTEPGEWLDVGLEQLVAELAEPLGVEVRVRAGVALAPFARFARQPGETAWSAIERACRLRGVLAHSSGDGALLVERPAPRRGLSRLVEGLNVLTWRVQENRRQRYSLYVVKAQHPGSDAYFGEVAALPEGRCEDPGVGRYRPLVVLAEGSLTFDGAQDRARWEATFRAARAWGADVRVAGWRQLPSGPPWRPNELLDVSIARAGFQGEALVSEVTFSRDLRDGAVTDLHLVRADAYAPQPTVDPAEDPVYGEGD